MMIWSALALLFACAISGTLLARLGWPFELFASLLPQIGAAILLFALAMVTLGRPGVALLALAAVALCVWGARELFTPADRPLQHRDVRILWANLLAEPDAFRRAMRVAVENDADIVVFAEFPHRISETQMRTIAGVYQHHAGRPALAGSKVAVFSRLPLSDVEAFGISWRPNQQGLAIRVATTAGPLAIVGVHPSVPGIPAAQRARDETARLAFARTREAGVSAVLLGDFNATSWSPVIRSGSADGTLTRGRLGAASTWMSPWPVLGLPIDHAFAANGARLSARLGPGIGSDHLPLIVDVQLAPPPV
jgi:endonuclease/exonuclease/phosphatase (EEP) superfamily protein YafD